MLPGYIPALHKMRLLSKDKLCWKVSIELTCPVLNPTSSQSAPATSGSSPPL